MKTLARELIKPLALAALVLAISGNGTAGSIDYLVTINTSSVSGSAGFLDFQFNPGNAGSQLAGAEITLFDAGGGTLGAAGSIQSTGDVTGTLPGTLIFTNDQSFNDYFQGFTYGSSVSFMLELFGPALSTPNNAATAGSTFGVGLYDDSQNPIVTDQGNTTGFAGSVDINRDGTTTTHAYPTGTERPSVTSFQQVVPEPATWILALLCACGLAAARKLHA
jgi:hypothetical protein